MADSTNTSDCRENSEFLGYPNKPLGPQVRRYEDTPSLFTVILQHFFPNGLKK